MTTDVQMKKITARTYDHAPGDSRPATRYEVSVSGIKVGEVYSRSTESWDLSPNGKIRTHFRGYSRTWGALAVNNAQVTRTASSRQRAVADLLRQSSAAPTPPRSAYAEQSAHGGDQS